MKEVLWNFKWNTWKICKKSSFLVNMRLKKRIHLHLIFKDFAKSLSNFDQDFWENWFRKPKLVLAETVAQSFSLEKVFLEILQNS